MLLLRREVFMQNKTKWKLSALVPSRSLDERTAIESQIKGLYLTSWCRHHNTVLGSKNCMSIFYISQRLTLWYFVFLYLIFLSQQVLYFLLSTLVLTLYIDVVLSLSILWEEHGVIRMLYGDMDFCVPTLYSTKLAPRLTFGWWIGEKDPVHQICILEPHCRVPSVARHTLSHWFWYDIILAGQMECISSEHFSEGCQPRTRTVYLVILVQLMLITWKLYSPLSVW